MLHRIRTALGLANLRTPAYRTRAGLWLGGELVHPRLNCLALLSGPRGKFLFAGENIVTTAGDVYLAQLAAGESPTNAFGVWEQCSAGTPGKSADRSDFTPIGSSELAHDGTYPQTDDGDSDNTGAGTTVVTRRASYSAASFNHAAITHAIITNSTPGASEPILTGFAWASAINKTASDTLKVFHNLTLLGV